MFKDISAILTDIEGTCTSLSFVKETLFPYSYDNMATFVAQHAQQAEIAPLLQQVAASMGDPPVSQEQIVQQLRDWIRSDQKIPALKSLQGYQWQYGYERGDFHGHLYEDAYLAFKSWRERGLALYVYSSGSVKAQQLLFAHTRFGDISNWFNGFFDTAVGAKVEPAAYQRIAQEIGKTASQILFLSDIEAELDAASESGMQVACLHRESSPLSSKYTIAKDFTQIDNSLS